MSEGKNDMEYEDSLGDLDLSLLGINASGEKGEDASITGDFSIKGEEEDDIDLEDISEETNKDKEEDLEESSNFEQRNSIEIRGEENDSLENFSLEEEEEDENSGASDFWGTMAESGLIDLEEGELEDKDLNTDLEWFQTKAKDKINTGIEEGVSDYKENLPPEIKYLLDNWEEGVSVSNLIQAEEKVLEYKSIDNDKIGENESIQKKLVSDLMTLQGESPEDIFETLEDYEVSGLLEKHAKRAKVKLVKYQETQKAHMIETEKNKQVQSQQAYEGWLTELKTSIDGRDEIIPGLKLNDKQRKTLYNGITRQDKEGKNEVMKFRETNEEFDLVVAYLATVLKTNDNKIDWSKLTQVAETKATQQLKAKAKSNDGAGISKRGRGKAKVDVNIMKNALNF